MNLIKLDNQNYSETKQLIIDALKNDGVVVVPFDTVYGFLCDARSKTALDKVYLVKGRNYQKPVGITINNPGQLADIAQASEFAINFILDYTPGRFTFLLPANDKAAIDLRCQKNGVIGVRIPDSKLIADLTQESSLTLAQTSANKAGGQNTFSVQEFLDQISEDDKSMIDLLVDGGEIENSAPSTIYDLTVNPPKRIERS